MSVFEADLPSPYYELVAKGQKQYEIRVYRDKWQYVRTGDVIRFKHLDDTPVHVKVLKVDWFCDFERAISETRSEHLFDSNYSIAEAVNIYENIHDYKTAASQFGVVRFKIALIDTKIITV